MSAQPASPLIIGNCSGFYGDRASAMLEMITGGELDVLTGDYLAELTMLILGRDRLKDPALGYARTFLRQLETALGEAMDRGVRIVTNAGGLSPARLAENVRELAARLGLEVAVAHVEGDDLLARADELGLEQGGPAQGGPARPLAANAYLGAWGITACLDAGADVVVTGRVTDASLVVGPAAAHFGWSRTSYDELAGAMVAGHVLECGPQATGGNYAFFTELGLDGRALGFPVAQVHADGSSVITKHPGTGGAVTVGTVTAQLLYEIGGARYAGPDATARFDTVELAQVGPDRVRISGVRGEAPPPTAKVGLNILGGFRNEVTYVLTGLDVEAKAALVRAQLARLDASLDLRWTLARTDHPDSPAQESSAALLHCVARGSDPAPLGRPFSGAAVELALASYPGFHLTTPPGEATPYGVFTSASVDASLVPHVAVLPDGSRVDIASAEETLVLEPVPQPAVTTRDLGPTRPAPLGTVVGARSGDKGGSANVGLWVRSDDAYAWLVERLTVDELRRLLPEVADLPVTRHLLPNLLAVNVVVDDVLGEGVAANVRHDPQAKAIGEWLRSRVVDIPEVLLP
ncbi:acyclic terpene utilization AtuA family protein [Dermatophilaceae bacterium Soc4.6]